MLKVKNNVGALYAWDKLFSMSFPFGHSEGLIYEGSPGPPFQMSFLLWDVMPSLETRVSFQLIHSFIPLADTAQN